MIWSLSPTRWSDRRTGCFIGLVALLKGLVWVALMPPFKIADEPSHYQNVAYRAEFLRKPQGNGKPVDKVLGPGAPPDVLYLWQATNRRFKSGYAVETRTVQEEAHLREMAREPANRRGDGQISSMNYPAAYYDLGVVAYDLVRGGTVLARLYAVRILSVLFGVLLAVSTFFAARNVMRSRALAVAAAFVAMLEPMSAQMTAAVNNDAGVIGFAALIFAVQLRILKQAPKIPTPQLGLLLGAACGCAVLSKPQGFALLPGSAFVCAVVMLPNLRARRAWAFAASVIVPLALLVVPYYVSTRQQNITLIPGRSPTPRLNVDFLTWVTSQGDGYYTYLFRSAIGQFGWLEFSIGETWLALIGNVLDLARWGFVAAVAVRLLWPREASWLSMRGLLFSAASALFAVTFILYAEYSFRLDGNQGVIQGRNFLFGLPAAAVAICACWGALVPARFRVLAATALITCSVALQVAAVQVVARFHNGI